VEGKYRLLADHQVAFTLGDYDTTRELVIDPVVTRIHGPFEGRGMNTAVAMARDAAGNLFVTGTTDGIDLPSMSEGMDDAYVCRVEAIGKVQSCVTFGGRGNEASNAIAIGTDGRVWVGGTTYSRSFPKILPLQPIHGDGGLLGDGFLVRMKNDLSSIDFSTFHGGNDADEILALSAGPDGSVLVAGTSASTVGFPTTQGVVGAQSAGGADAFLSKVTADARIAFSTLLGGTGDDSAHGIAVTPDGGVLMAGRTSSTDFPTVNAHQRSFGGGQEDAFFAMLDRDGSAIRFSSYLGGSGTDGARAIAHSPGSEAVMIGNSSSEDFPTLRARQRHLGGAEWGADTDGFIARISSSGELGFATYHGGNGHDNLEAVAVDRAANIHVGGSSESTDYPDTSGAGHPWFVPPYSLDTAPVATYSKLNPRGELLESWFEGAANEGTTRGIVVESPTRVSVLEEGFESGQEGYNIATISQDSSLQSWSADFNGDGRDDVLWRNAHTGAGVIWHSADATLAQRITTVTNLDWRIATIGDFDGDGASDIIWRNERTGANAIWPGAEYTSGAALATVSDLNWRVVAAGDLDGDGLDELIWHNDATGRTSAWTSADFHRRRELVRIGNPSWDIIGAGDFDGDGKDDLLWERFLTKSRVVWRSGDYATQHSLHNGESSWVREQVLGIGDFDANGREDVLVTWICGAQYGDGIAVRFPNQLDWGCWSGPTMTTSGDYDGDGQADILRRDLETGVNYIYRGGEMRRRLPIRRVSSQSWVPHS
jgi:hypothetical protein